MNQTNLNVMLQMQNNASPQLKAFGEDVRQTSTVVQSSGTQMSTSMGGVGQSLVNNKQAMMEMSSGVRYLGTTFLALGLAMQSSNNETIRSIGSMLTMVGAIATVVGSAAGFVGAIGQMTTALKALNIQRIIGAAFSGPVGWAVLGVGAAAAIGTVAVVSARSRGERDKPAIVVNNNVQGSIYSRDELGKLTMETIVKAQDRNGTSGVR